MKMDTFNVCMPILLMWNLIINHIDSHSTKSNTTKQCLNTFEKRCPVPLKYYCLKTVNRTLIEMCSAPLYFYPSDGCPVYNGTIQFLYDRCISDEGCPPRNVTKQVSLGEIYKYPACLELPKAIAPKSRSHGHLTTTSLVTGSPGSPGFQRNIYEENVLTPFALTLGILFFAFVLGNLINIVVVVKMLKKRNRKATFQGGEMSDLPNESTEQIYNTVDETCLTVAV